MTSGKVILSSFLFISRTLNWPWNARAHQLPVYPRCNFTSGTILCIGLTHALPLYRILNLQIGFLSNRGFWSVCRDDWVFSVLNRETPDQIGRVWKHGLTPGGSQVGTLKQRSPSSKFFSENGRHRALIFGMQHLLVDIYQICSYDAPRVKIGPTLGSQIWT